MINLPTRIIEVEKNVQKVANEMVAEMENFVKTTSKTDDYSYEYGLRVTKVTDEQDFEVY